ncbi:TNF receptor-associated factor 6-A-like [Argopecten irradians]|uniref:TNF receptor-associated factor 6-A-like n=1 Tax=Argopecten irradians TaxID=31199 RepID=UPI003717FD03
MEASVSDQQLPQSMEASLAQEPLFDEDLDRKFMCPVCLCVLKEPVQTSCGHRFCRACIMGTIDLPFVRHNVRVPYSKCPVDNTYFHIEKELFCDNAIKREVLSLNVRCPNVETGCEWNGELRDYIEHEEQCQFKMVYCKNTCGVRVLRKDMPDHLENCELRIVFCPHCHEGMTHKIISKHEVLVCQNFPVQCLQCGRTGIKRKDISAHTSKDHGDCPITIIDCPFKVYGCKKTTTRLCMRSHIYDYCHTHLSLMTEHVRVQDQRIAELSHEVKAIRGMLTQNLEKHQSSADVPGTSSDNDI